MPKRLWKIKYSLGFGKWRTFDALLPTKRAAEDTIAPLVVSNPQVRVWSIERETQKEMEKREDKLRRVQEAQKK